MNLFLAWKILKMEITFSFRKNCPFSPSCGWHAEDTDGLFCKQWVQASSITNFYTNWFCILISISKQVIKQDYPGNIGMLWFALFFGIYETFVISRLNLGVPGQFQMIWIDKNVSHNIWTTNDIKTCDF